MKKGSKHSKESIEKMKENQKGEKNGMFGKKHTKKSRRNMSISKKELFRNGYINPFKGKKHSIKSKDNMSKLKIGKNNPMFGKKQSEISKRKAVISRKKFYKRNPDKVQKGKNHPMFGKFGKDNPNYKQKRPSMTGNNNPAKRIEVRKKLSDMGQGNKNNNWRGGISFEPYSSKFNKKLKEQIRKRDNHICQICSRTTKENKRALPIHHIDYNKLNCNKNNLITTCNYCNSRLNFNRKYYEWQLKVFMNLFHNANHIIDWKWKDETINR